MDTDVAGNILNETTSRIRPNSFVKTITAIDIGIRNMGIVTFDVIKNKVMDIRWVDLFPEPDVWECPPAELVPRFIQYYSANRSLFDTDHWFIELQLINEKKIVDTTVVQTCIQTLGLDRAIPVNLLAPLGIKPFFGDTFKGTNHAENKTTAIDLTKKLMYEDELEAFQNLVRKRKEDKKQATLLKTNKPIKVQPDDPADAFLIAILAGSILTKRNFIKERCGNGVEMFEPPAPKKIKGFTKYNLTQLQEFALQSGIDITKKTKAELIVELTNK
jgi:hypothetical protein